MAILSRWYLVRFGRGSRMPKFGSRRGHAPAFFDYLDTVQRPGMWMGAMSVASLAVGVGVVAFDDALVDPVDIQAEFARLRAAPDARIFDLRAGFSTGAGSWARLAAFKTALEALHVDAGRLNEGGKNVRHVFREATRHLLLYHRMAATMPTLALDATQADIPAVMRSALHDRLLELGFPSGKLGSPTDTLRAWYRSLLAGFGAELEEGRWHVARRDLNLKGSGGGAVIG